MAAPERLGTLAAHEHTAGSDPDLAPWRRTVVRVLIHFVLVASAVDIAIDGDHWPFSSYSMYAELRAPEVRLKRFYGVSGGREVELDVPVHIQPFSEARLMTAIRRLGRRADAPAARVAALAGALQQYESLRAAGTHDGPALDALRFYELTWPLTEGARNRDEPATRRLIAEAWR